MGKGKIPPTPFYVVKKDCLKHTTLFFHLYDSQVMGLYVSGTRPHLLTALHSYTVVLENSSPVTGASTTSTHCSPLALTPTLDSGISGSCPVPSRCLAVTRRQYGGSSVTHFKGTSLQRARTTSLYGYGTLADRDKDYLLSWKQSHIIENLRLAWTSVPSRLER